MCFDLTIAEVTSSRSNKYMKKLLSFTGIFATILFVPFLTFAAVFESEDVLSFSIPVRDDLYAAGGTITVNEQISGDMFVAGGQVSIGAPITQDLVGAGGTIVVSESIGDDVRIAGGDVIIDARVGDDLIVAGGSLTLGNDTEVKGDATLTGGELLIDGIIRGDTIVAAGAVVINGALVGDAKIQADEVVINGVVSGESTIAAQRITLGPDARFDSNVTYWEGRLDGSVVDFTGSLATGVTATVDESLSFSEGTHSVNLDTFAVFRDILSAMFFFSVLSAAVVLALMMWIAPKLLVSSADYFGKSFGKSFITGFLFFIVLPILAVILMVTVIGWPLAVLAWVLWLFSLYLAKIFAATCLVLWYDKKNKKKWSKPALWLWSLVIFAALKALMFIPVLGWIASWIIASAGLGAHLMARRDVIKKFR